MWADSKSQHAKPRAANALISELFLLFSLFFFFSSSLSLPFFLLFSSLLYFSSPYRSSGPPPHSLSAAGLSVVSPVFFFSLFFFCVCYSPSCVLVCVDVCVYRPLPYTLHRLHYGKGYGRSELLARALSNVLSDFKNKWIKSPIFSGYRWLIKLFIFARILSGFQVISE